MKQLDFEREYQKTICGERFIEEKISQIPEKKYYLFIKRAFDVIFSLTGLVVFLFPALIISILVKISSKGPVFYLQDRLGQNSKPFRIIKFRTMNVDAESQTGPIWAEKEDLRVTKFGKFLRKTHLDEIPQFVNVLKGDMSMVGPRPEREWFYREFSKYIDGFEQRMLVAQGLTGLAQICGDYDIDPEKKIIYDLYYIKHRSLFLDLKILVKTIL